MPRWLIYSPLLALLALLLPRIDLRQSSMTAHPPADHTDQVGPAPSSASSHGAKPTLLMDQVVMFGGALFALLTLC